MDDGLLSPRTFLGWPVASNLSGDGPSWQIRMIELSIALPIDDLTGVFTRFIKENNLSTNAFDTGQGKKKADN